MNHVHELLLAHRSIRAFTDQVLPDETVAAIVACGLAAATSSNVQATTVIRVRDEGTRQRIAEVAGGQQHIVHCGAFLVWCADLHRSAQAALLRGETMNAGQTEQFVIATVDVALAAQNAVVAAESLGLGICYIGAIRNDPAVVTELLGLPDQVYPVFGLCLGWPGADPQVKPRLPLAATLMEETYTKEGEIAHIEAYDETMRAYYGARRGGSKDSSWSQEMAGLLGKERRAHMRGFLAERGFEMR